MGLLEKDMIRDKWLGIVKNEWLLADDTYPAFLNATQEDTKVQNEQYIRRTLAEFQKLIPCFPRTPFGRKRWARKAFELINDILHKETVLSLHNYLDPMEIDDFYNEIKDFLKHVRKFAPELSFQDIGQAIRNYIVYAVFKKIHRLQSGYSRAGFGYSMLYPFTDNYIDCTTYTDQQKQEYNRVIREKIEGKKVPVKLLHHKKTCDLLQAIESSYSRDKDPTIFSLLLMMLEAQEDSIRQQKRGYALTTEERLDISVYKGGISVLIDRFLVNKEVTEADIIFYLGYGLFLQLADDLQDIGEDSMRGWQTLFTEDVSCNREEKLVNKMLNFIYKITEQYRAENEDFKNFIAENCYRLVFTSVIQSKEYFSENYLDSMAANLPVTYTFYENIKNNSIENKDFKIQKKYMKILDAIIS